MNTNENMELSFEFFHLIKHILQEYHKNSKLLNGYNGKDERIAPFFCGRIKILSEIIWEFEDQIENLNLPEQERNIFNEIIEKQRLNEQGFTDELKSKIKNKLEKELGKLLKKEEVQ